MHAPSWIEDAKNPACEHSHATFVVCRKYSVNPALLRTTCAAWRVFTCWPHDILLDDSPDEQPHLPLVHGWPEGQIVLQLPQAKILLVVS